MKKILKVGDRVYDFQDKSYEEIMYIEYPKHLSSSRQVYITWKAHKEGLSPFKEEVKDFSTYLSLDADCYIVAEEDGQNDGDIIVDTPMRFIEVENYVYLDEVRKVVKISYLSPKEDNMGTPSLDVCVFWFESKHDERHLTLDASHIFKLHIHPEDLKQSQKNY